MKSHRATSLKTDNQHVKSTHMQQSQINRVQQNLNRQDLLAKRYHQQAHERYSQIDSKNGYQMIKITGNIFKGNKRRPFSVTRHQQAAPETNHVEPDIKDYSKLIVGLQYSLQTERRKNEELIELIQQQKSQLQNFQFLLQKSQNFRKEKAANSKWQQKISQLQISIKNQKGYYENLIDSKNQILLSLQKQIANLKKALKNKLNKQDQAIISRVFQLSQQIQELQNNLAQKHIMIQKMKLMLLQQTKLADEIQKLKSVENVRIFMQQIQMSNNMLMRKNAEIVKQTNQNMRLQKVLQAIEAYIENDQSRIKRIQMNVLEHPCVNKLRILLRQKRNLSKQLLSQLDSHSKQLISLHYGNNSPKQTKEAKRLKVEIEELSSNNRKLTSTIFILQDKIVSLQKKIHELKVENHTLEKQVNFNEEESAF